MALGASEFALDAIRCPLTATSLCADARLQDPVWEIPRAHWLQVVELLDGAARVVVQQRHGWMDAATVAVSMRRAFFLFRAPDDVADRWWVSEADAPPYMYINQIVMGIFSPYP